MKSYTKQIMFLLASLILLALPTLAWAAETTQLRLEIPQTSLEMGKEVTLNVWIENTTPMYGAEAHLSFDPERLTVVDADPSVGGIKLHPGAFLDPEQGFILQNEADNQAGTIDYALTLLNPAPSVEGSGLFFSVTFRIEGTGPTVIRVDKSLLSSRDSQPIEHSSEDITLEIDDHEGTTNLFWIMIAVAVGFLLLFALFVIQSIRLKRAQRM